MNLESILICPYSKKKLNKVRNYFISEDKSNKYKINKKELPLFYKENTLKMRSLKKSIMIKSQIYMKKI